jgi:hypothetical protein
MDSLYLVLLSSALFLCLGVALEMGSSHPASDFRFVYNGARCLIQHADPYKQSEFVRVYLADGGDLGSGFDRQAYMEMARHMYLPTNLLIAPLAMLPWKPAFVIWTILTAVSFMLGSLLMWHLGAKYAPVLSGFLVAFFLATSESLLLTGNATGVAVGLAVIAVWCFVEERFVRTGVILLAISLMLKPHEAGLVWLYFLLAGGVYRKRALQTLGAVVALSAPLLVWVTVVAPHWLPELRSNLAVLSSHGHLDDPGPASMGGHGVGMIIDLQSVISMFRDDPRIYNPASYLICGVLLVVWSLTTLRSRPTPARAWIALASIAALSMLPVYHRLGDSKLLLITVPACAMLWAEGGLIGRAALAINTAAILLTGELQWAIFLRVLGSISQSSTAFSEKLRVAVQVFPVPLMLLVVSVFYLWVYIRRASDKTGDEGGKLCPAAANGAVEVGTVPSLD